MDKMMSIWKSFYVLKCRGKSIIEMDMKSALKNEALKCYVAYVNMNLITIFNKEHFMPHCLPMHSSYTLNW